LRLLDDDTPAASGLEMHASVRDVRRLRRDGTAADAAVAKTGRTGNAPTGETQWLGQWLRRRVRGGSGRRTISPLYRPILAEDTAKLRDSDLSALHPASDFRSGARVCAGLLSRTTTHE